MIVLVHGGRNRSELPWLKPPRADWHLVKLDLMRRADWAKSSQHPDLATLLLGTGSAELIEDSPFDPFWGTGPDGAGLIGPAACSWRCAIDCADHDGGKNSADTEAGKVRLMRQRSPQSEPMGEAGGGPLGPPGHAY
jgi:hypothetical protein